MKVCPGSGWPSTTTMSNSAGTGQCGICKQMVEVGPLNQCHTHAAPSVVGELAQLECGQCHGKGAIMADGRMLLIPHAKDCDA